MSNNPFAKVDNETKAIASNVRQPGAPASAVYPATVTAAFLAKNPWNANEVDLVMHFELESGYQYKLNKAVLRDGSPMAVNPKTKKKELLWGYTTMSRIIGAATDGKTFNDIYGSIQKKKVNIFDFETRKDVLTDVNMVTDLVGKKLYLGLQRKIANKVIKDETTGEWIPQAERKETAEFGVAGSITDRRTFSEMNESAEEATDLDKWGKLNTGKDWDAYKPVTGAATGMPAGLESTEEDLIDFSV